MHKPEDNFEFRTITAKDKALIYQWLKKPHVAKWFHGEGLKNTISGIEDFIDGKPDGSCRWLGYIHDKPFAFLLTSTVEPDQSDSPDCPMAEYIEPDKKMMTFDLLIGEESYLGKGLAIPMLKSFLKLKCKSVDIVFIDPEATNTVAIHVYEKLGFIKLKQFIASWHPVPHWLMMLELH